MVIATAFMIRVRNDDRTPPGYRGWSSGEGSLQEFADEEIIGRYRSMIGSHSHPGKALLARDPVALDPAEEGFSTRNAEM